MTRDEKISFIRQNLGDWTPPDSKNEDLIWRVEERRIGIDEGHFVYGWVRSNIPDMLSTPQLIDSTYNAVFTVKQNNWNRLQSQAEKFMYWCENPLTN